MSVSSAAEHVPAHDCPTEIDALMALCRLTTAPSELPRLMRADSPTYVFRALSQRHSDSSTLPPGSSSVAMLLCGHPGHPVTTCSLQSCCELTVGIVVVLVVRKGVVKVTAPAGPRPQALPTLQGSHACVHDSCRAFSSVCVSACPRLSLAGQLPADQLSSALQTVPGSVQTH